MARRSGPQGTTELGFGCKAGVVLTLYPENEHVGRIGRIVLCRKPGIPRPGWMPVGVLIRNVPFTSPAIRIA